MGWHWAIEAPRVDDKAMVETQKICGDYHGILVLVTHRDTKNNQCELTKGLPFEISSAWRSAFGIKR